MRCAAAGALRLVIDRQRAEMSKATANALWLRVPSRCRGDCLRLNKLSTFAAAVPPQVTNTFLFARVVPSQYSSGRRRRCVRRIMTRDHLVPTLARWGVAPHQPSGRTFTTALLHLAIRERRITLARNGMSHDAAG